MASALSLDDDFRDLHFRWIAERKVHSGIFLGNQKLQGEGSIGFIVSFIINFADDVLDMTLIENDLIPIE